MRAIEKKQIQESNPSTKKACRTIWLLLGIVLLAATSLSSVAHAGRERIVLDFDDSYYHATKGETATLFLKRELRQQYPGLRFRESDLRKVVLIAKSKKGRGKAHLRVGQNRSRSVRVDGRPNQFHDNRRHSFDRIKLHNPSHNSSGPWQIKLNGNFVVRKVVLILDNYDYPDHRGWYSWNYRYQHER